MRFTSPDTVQRHRRTFQLLAKVPYRPLRAFLLTARRRELRSQDGARTTDDCREDVLEGLRAVSFSNGEVPDGNLAEQYVSYAHCDRDVELFTLAVKGGDERFRKRYLTIRGEEHLRRLRDSGQGAVLACATFGPFAMIPPLLLSLGYEVVAAARREAAELYGELANSLAGVSSATMPLWRADDRGVLVRCASALRRGKLALLYAEVGTHGNIRTTDVTFLGRRIAASAGPATLAVSAHVPLVPVALLSRGGHFELDISEPLVTSIAGAEGAGELTRRTMAVIEQWVHRDPQQWYGWHRVAEAILAGDAGRNENG